MEDDKKAETIHDGMLRVLMGRLGTDERKAVEAMPRGLVGISLDADEAGVHVEIMNAAIVFNRMAANGDFDALSEDGYQALLDATNDLAALWCNRERVRPTALVTTITIYGESLDGDGTPFERGLEAVRRIADVIR